MNSTAVMVLLGVLFALFLWAMVELLQCLNEAAGVRKGVERVQRAVLPEEAFLGKSHAREIAVAIARKVLQPRVLAQLHPERELTAISTELAAHLGRARALSGLLIILGLLITLMNLRVATENMGATLAPRASAVGASGPAGPPTPRDTAPADRIREGIEGVASAASKAFLYSAIAIGLAAVIVLGSVLAQRKASFAVRSFGAWLTERREVFLSDQTEQPTGIDAKLERAADVLARTALTFERTHTALTDLKLLGTTFETAAQDITNAVSTLPAQFDTSMAKISGDVAHGIRDGLDHQGEYLKALVAIYGEHGLILAETIAFIREIAQDSKSSAAALTSLGELPGQIERFSAAAASSHANAGSLTAALEKLDRQIAGLPADDLMKAASALSEAAIRVAGLAEDVSAMRRSVDSMMESTTQEATRRSTEALLPHIAAVEAGLKSLQAGVSADTARHWATLKEALTRLSGEIGQLRDAKVAADIRPLKIQIDHLSASVQSLPSWQAMRLFRAARRLLGGK